MHSGLAMANGWIFYARMGQLSVARQYFEEALRLDPGYAPALRGIEEL